jgi:hypothetical protein
MGKKSDFANKFQTLISVIFLKMAIVLTSCEETVKYPQ